MTKKQAIVDGLRDSINIFTSEDGAVPKSNAKDVIDLLLLTQYFDTLRDIGIHQNTSTVFLQPQGSSIRDGFMQAGAGGLV